MERGLYIAASGMVAEQMRQDQIANDLANASTPGYKADRVTQRAFADLLLSNTASGQAIGGLTPGVAADRMVTDTSPQPVRDTGEPLDLAIVGDGWFAVQTSQGTRYTRATASSPPPPTARSPTSSATACSVATASRRRSTRAAA